MVLWLRICLPVQGLQFVPWSGNWTPHAATTILQTTTRDPICWGRDPRSCLPQINTKEETQGAFTCIYHLCVYVCVCVCVFFVKKFAENWLMYPLKIIANLKSHAEVLLFETS